MMVIMLMEMVVHLLVNLNKNGFVIIRIQLKVDVKL